MSQITIGCWNAGCRATFDVSCRDSNQVLHCRMCSQVADFVNLGAVRCERCDRWKRLSLRFGLPSLGGVRCDHCRVDVNTEAPIRIFSFDEFLCEFGAPGGLSYCGADEFRGHGEEVVIAREALARRVSARPGRRAFGLLPPAPKKAMFIRRLAPQPMSNRELPIQYLQLYHAYCNFNLNLGHQNTKLVGTLAQFASDDEIFHRLQQAGLSEIWFGDALTKREFELAPTASRARMFRLA
jgi:hypothetical protein